ncbi:MAG: hypothetical protein H0V45_11725 [Actinobacteria bacterium]|nr:hypothetical protein [Actinomycetota bacterium]
MKRFFLLVAALTALVATGAAVANMKAGDVSQVSATLSAATVAHLQTRTITCEGQTIEISNGRYTGTSTSTTPDLAGPVELKVRSVYNTTKKLGWVEGHLKVRADDDRSNARFAAVNVDGKLDGWLTGKAGQRDGILLGSLTGSFTSAGGLTEGQLGAGTGANAAIIAKRIECKEADKTRPSVRLTVRGQVNLISDSSISVKPADGASQACTIGERKPKDIAVGDRVEMTCSQVGGAWVLTKIRERG